MITFLTIRDFDTNQHEISDYVICFMYFEKNKNDIFFKIMIRREVHLILYFKINMLINNDVICFESIVINSMNKKIYIDSCDVIVSIKIRFETRRCNNVLFTREKQSFYRHVINWLFQFINSAMNCLIIAGVFFWIEWHWFYFLRSFNRLFYQNDFNFQWYESIY